MMDHASLFTEIVHPYLPKLYITIYQNCTLLFTNYGTLLFTDYMRPESYNALDDLVDYLKRKPNERIEIGGHTDNVGSDAKNLVLSLERAKSIVAYLIVKGIENDRLVAKGYGAEEPIEENTSGEGRQKNRRTEVKILDQDQASK